MTKFDKNFERIFAAFDKALENADTSFKKAKSATSATTETYLIINFGKPRLKTFFRFIKCAFQVLFTGKTKLFVKKK